MSARRRRSAADRRWLAAVVAVLAGACTQESTSAREPVIASASQTTLLPAALAPSTLAPTTTFMPSTTIGDVLTTAPSLTTVPLLSSSGTRDWSALASVLGPLAVPSDCPLPLAQPGLMPNSDRSYRGGIHQGIDFICLEYGHVATTPLAGRVLLSVATYDDPSPEDRVKILDEARSLGYTPPYTLQFLFGRFVVVDHGVIDGVGHVVSIYAHLQEVDPAVRPGVMLSAGAVVGRIGNSGTETAATGGTRPQSIHLHWELYIDDVAFPSGLGEAATSSAVAQLFGR